ncbi:hypothetical protein SEA_CHIKPIC_42 [Microbacterium phage ChikPic]|nr:hypothetical protein SEA_CHIKPIC_42 [Microbacterium phage ChikPic]
MFGEHRIPRVAYPHRKASETITVNSEDLLAEMGHTNEAIYRLTEKLNAEQERLIRLLPEPLPGFYWDFEFQQTEDLPGYRVLFRVVAVLKER